jgi:hypothetical protein
MWFIIRQPTLQTWNLCHKDSTSPAQLKQPAQPLQLPPSEPWEPAADTTLPDDNWVLGDQRRWSKAGENPAPEPGTPHSNNTWMA